jgi:hypothetical protein
MVELAWHTKDIASRFAGERSIDIAPDHYSRLGYTVTADSLGLCIHEWRESGSKR